jgi:hypothetical protein
MNNEFVYKNIKILKELFCNSINLNETDFKTCWNFIFDELISNESIYKFDICKINFDLLNKNTQKALNCDINEIKNVSCLFVGFYVESQNRIQDYEYFKIN